LDHNNGCSQIAAEQPALSQKAIYNPLNPYHLKPSTKTFLNAKETSAFETKKIKDK
jgi:hypothetical protein